MHNRIDLFLELEHVFRLFFRQYRKDLNKLIGDTMTGTEYSFLYHLSTKSPQIVTELSQEFHVSVSHITHIIDQLESKELVFRRRSQTDKRVVEIHISEQGNSCVNEISQRKHEYIAAQFSKLTTNELVKLTQLFKKMM
ncbi:DNA-binding transcriptional regulator, MarR family [Seinonella peptonophila]|uniref:HTH-type transcriptional regulator SarZ n=1 Tax=Seinonella peptonophila TaxID=112248 RepID=A0A1M4U7S0_9BACL|nr:MarR family transcriptional regulator [Seinonella peptonophila]SHE52819.1 DNA-binding transcriptional regulator, MarR family [Seinonella peptonophila]